MKFRNKELENSREFEGGIGGRNNRMYEVYDDGSVLVNYDERDSTFTIKAKSFEFTGEGTVDFYNREGDRMALMRYTGTPSPWIRYFGDGFSGDFRVEPGFGAFFAEALAEHVGKEIDPL